GGEHLRLLARHPIFTDPRARVDDAGAETDDLARRLRHGLASRLSVLRGRLERADGRLAHHRPAAEYARRAGEVGRLAALLRGAIEGRLRRDDVAPLAARLHRAWRGSIERTSLEVEAAERSLALVGPISVLRRGFSCTLRDDGAAVRSVGD